MVLRWIAYEAIDIIYFTTKIGYNGVSGMYNWYFSLPKEEESEHLLCQPEMIEEFKRMKIQIALLEQNSRISDTN